MNGKAEGQLLDTFPCDNETNNCIEDKRTPSLRGEVLGADTTEPAVANRCSTVFLIVSLPNDNTERFGSISTTNVHILRYFDSIPLCLFSFWLSMCSFCSNCTIHTQTGIYNPMPSGIGNDTHQTTSQSGSTAVGAGGPFLA